MSNGLDGDRCRRGDQSLVRGEVVSVTENDDGRIGKGTVGIVRVSKSLRVRQHADRQVELVRSPQAVERCGRGAGQDAPDPRRTNYLAWGECIGVCAVANPDERARFNGAPQILLAQPGAEEFGTAGDMIEPRHDRREVFVHGPRLSSRPAVTGGSAAFWGESRRPSGCEDGARRQFASDPPRRAGPSSAEGRDHSQIGDDEEETAGDEDPSGRDHPERHVL